ncbi:MAG: hypothetical protein ACRDAM_16085 [Casimicrobium sp.]
MQNSWRATARIEIVSFRQISDDASLDRIIAEIAKRSSFAVIRAMTATVKDAQAALTDTIPVVFDRPNAWTRQAIGIQSATRAVPTAAVFVKDSQANYLAYQIDGGQRSLKPFELQFRNVRVNGYMIPGEASTLDQFGNVSKADILNLSRSLNASDASKNYFVGTPKNSDRPPGIYERTAAGGLRLVFLQATSARYAPAFDFYGIARTTIRDRLKANLIAAIKS